MSRLNLQEKERYLDSYSLGIHFRFSNIGKSLLSSHEIIIGCYSPLVMTFDFCHAASSRLKKQVALDCDMIAHSFQLDFGSVSVQLHFIHHDDMHMNDAV